MSAPTNLRLKSKLYFYAAHVTAVYDADTITVDLDLGLGTWRHSQHIRLWKINAPELKGPEREKGLQVRDLVRELVLDKDVLVRTILDKRGVDSTEKYGRLLGEILVSSADDKVINVNQHLLDAGLVRPMSESGSMVAGIAGAGPQPGETPSTLACPYCGQIRRVTASGQVKACPNCLDAPYRLF